MVKVEQRKVGQEGDMTIVTVTADEGKRLYLLPESVGPQKIKILEALK